jgi:broad specificity phosphatase PhoE
MSTTIVHLVRHGEVHNPTQVLYGRLPSFHLSSRGASQAAATAASFTGHDVAYLAASPLTRAQETSRPFADVTGLQVETDEDLIESWNDYEGLRTKGWRSQLLNPKHWPRMTRPSEPSWGEPYGEILARMMDAVERARLAAEGHEAILVSHQLPIVTVQRSVRGLPLPHSPWRRECDLASVSSLIFQGEEIADIYYSTPAREI